MNINKISKEEFVNFTKNSFEISDTDCEPIKIRIKKPDLFIASYLVDEYKNIDPDLSGLVTVILRNVGRMLFRLQTLTSFRYISRITWDDRLCLPHNDIFEIMKIVRGDMELPLHKKFHKIRFEPLSKEYNDSTFVIHDQCISDGTTTLNLFNILRPFKIKLIGTDIAMYYYHLMPEHGYNDRNAKVSKTNNLDQTETVKADSHWEESAYREGAMFDHSGILKQIKIRGALIQYQPISRKARMLKEIVSNLIRKIQYKGLAKQYIRLFIKMKQLLNIDIGADTVRYDGYVLYRKKFLNPQYKYHPEIVFKEHDICKPFNEQCSIMTVFNAVTSHYFTKKQIETVIPVLCNGLKNNGLLFIGESEFNNISYSVFQKVEKTLTHVYDVGKGTIIKDFINEIGEFGDLGI